ncbi:penicillin-binding protein activator LpoB [Helicobacter sp. 11S02596-1]|uniref:penicillin-binding protein activator LpoB n=1 Tax=Helicobacter sp. 11S02596-1 TaxID=1476194 RepID=UPI000BA5D944|nr:penicillin-binding protein activator LpoB [Helicobacter sp. 11S02596-1]PAF44468.1 penicillin-binding protein activator LpoB [Helicobacter sp. 11S02596-1]
MNQKFIYASIMGVLILAGCASKVEYIDQKDSKSYSSIGLDQHDIEDAASKSVQSLLQSGYVKNLATAKKPKVLAISDVVNDTMQNFSTEELTRKITRDMRNSGKFILTMAISGSGGSTDKMIAQARDARKNDEFNQYTVQEKGTLIAPELSLSGKIVQRNTKVGSKQRVDYFFLLSLTDIKTGLVVWDDEVNIIKLGKNKSVAW